MRTASTATPAEEQPPELVEGAETQATTTPAADGTTETPPSSAAGDKSTDANAPAKSTLDIVREVVKPKPAGASSEPDEAKPDKSVAQPEADKMATESEKDKQPPFHTHPRWQEKLRETATLKSQVESLTGDAEQHRKVVAFMDQNDLTAEDTAKLLIVGSLIKKDPERAIAELEKTLEELRTATGNKLPVELQKAVDEGEITEERALELSKAKATAARATADADTVKQRGSERDAREEAHRQVTAIGNTIAGWETTQKGKDPDFARKQPLVEEFTAAAVAKLRQDGKTNFSVEDVQKILDQSLAKVNANLKAFIPPKPTVKAPLKSSSSATVTPRPVNGEAKSSTLDIVKATLAG